MSSANKFVLHIYLYIDTLLYNIHFNLNININKCKKNFFTGGLKG